MEYLEIERNCPKVNVWCGLMCDRVVGPFFFKEPTVKAANYLDMLENFVFPQINNLQPNIIFQQDGAPPHWGLHVRDALDREYPNRWIGRECPTSWPARSPLDFFGRDFSKTLCFQLL